MTCQWHPCTRPSHRHSGIMGMLSLHSPASWEGQLGLCKAKPLATSGSLSRLLCLWVQPRATKHTTPPRRVPTGYMQTVGLSWRDAPRAGASAVGAWATGLMGVLTSSSLEV